MISVVILSLETASGLLLYYWYRAYIPGISQGSVRAASIVLIKKLYAKYFPRPSFNRISYLPEPYFVPDPIQGYKAVPGEFIVRYARRIEDKFEYLNTKQTNLADGTRFTGIGPNNPDRHVYVFGDSFVFGAGVNDEQTFTYLLQSSFPTLKFHLYALDGYSWSNALVNISYIKGGIRENDILILGYADFYKGRHLPSPSYLRNIETWSKETYPTQPLNVEMRLLHTNMTASGDLTFDIIPYYCRFLQQYCDQSDPSEDYVNDLSKALLREIAMQAKVKIFLLHFSGPSSDPVLSQLPSNVELISALPQDFDYTIRDDVLGFDPHPGPYWHNAMYSRLKEVLSKHLEEERPSAVAQ